MLEVETGETICRISHIPANPASAVNLKPCAGKLSGNHAVVISEQVSVTVAPASGMWFRVYRGHGT